ncbi:MULTISPECIES: hypothetical protein [unclassified Lysinibacillus]|uniref:hypothetical protein n=1 Tax=unclassified Lysinibacillus TaxID=2636778 RepID=UPI0037F2FE44
MTVIGGNLEKKEIGLPIGVSGTHDRTEINKTTGFLQLLQVDTDGQGRPIFTEQGSWTSDVIDLGDTFKDFEKVFTTNTNNGASSFAVLTRVSSNNYDWSDWTAIAMDGTIQSDTKQFIQVRIDLFAGFVTDEFIISSSDFETNEFVEVKKVKEGSYIVPKLTSNTPTSEGFPFASSIFSSSYSVWNAFDKSTSTYFCTIASQTSGFLGFYFNSKKRVSKYKITSSTSSSQISYMPKNWFLQGSDDTTDGVNGEWRDLDKQTNQIWTTTSEEKVYTLSSITKYHAYRIKWSDNNGHATYSGIGELDFYEEGTSSLSLKRDYQYDMTLDKTWSDTGSLHRKKVTLDDWVKIDRLEVKQTW